VAVDGDTVVVGSTRSGSGAGYLFEQDQGGPGKWGQVAKLTASDGSDGDSLGRSVSISGDTVATGAPGDDDDGSNSGAVYVYEEPGAGWADATETIKLTADDGYEGDNFGYAVSISGDVIAIGARYDDDTADQWGSAYLFARDEIDPGSWSQAAKAVPVDSEWPGPEGLQFGRSVSYSGETLAGGALAPYQEQGSAFLFRKFEPVAFVYLPLVLRGGP
jgi:hypothetical protein